MKCHYSRPGPRYEAARGDLRVEGVADAQLSHNVGVADMIERAREAFGRQAWASTYELLAAASEKGPLDVEDLEHLAIAAYLIGKDDESAQAWERAHLECLRLEDPADAARCAFWLGFALLLRGEMARAGGWLARGSRLVEEGELDCVARGYLLLPAVLQALQGRDAGRAYALSTEAGDIAERFGDKDLLAFAWAGGGQALIALGETARGVALLDEMMIVLTTGEVSPILVGIGYCVVIEVCMDVFDLRRAAEWTEALSGWCQAQPDLVPYRGQCLVYRSRILQAHGEWPKAASEAQRARERLSQPPHPALGVALYQQAELHRLRGEFEQAKEAYRLASQYGCEPAPGLALLRLAEGHVAAAAAASRRVVDQTHGHLARPTMLAAHVEIMLAAGDVEAARVAVDELSKIAAEMNAPLLRAIADYAGGSVRLAQDNASSALGDLRRAYTGWWELAMPYEAARTRVLIGLACRAVGDEDSAEWELDAARAAFEQLGAQPDLTRMAELVGTGLTPASTVTARECEVLRLVAEGKSNREIGSTLFISEHTVARHLQNIFAKLNLPSRAAATAYAYEHGLV